MQTVKESDTPFAEIEKQLKIKIKDDLLPLLGPEVVVSVPVKFLEEGRPTGATSPQPDPSEPSAADQKQTNSPGWVIALSLKDKEGMRSLLPRLVDHLGFKGASALAHTERLEDTEMVSYGNIVSYAFIGNFLVLSADVPTTRHVVDSYLKHETLSSDPQFKNYTRWQPRQVQAQIYVSPALMESYKTWADQPSTLISDQTREFLSRLGVVAQPVTYSLSNEGLGPLHELHVPKNLVLMAVAALTAGSNPSPMLMNERMTLGGLGMIAAAEREFRSGKGAGSFGTIEQLIDEQLISRDQTENSGYKIEIIAGGTRFEASAVPIEYGKTGKISYFVDETGVVRGGDHAGGMATVADRPVQ
jgi:Protein of unknown function (DUF3352)